MLTETQEPDKEECEDGSTVLKNKGKNTIAVILPSIKTKKDTGIITRKNLNNGHN